MRPEDARLLARLLRKAQRGDRGALEALVVRFSALVSSLARDDQGRYDEDLAQELYVELLRAVGRFVPGRDAPAFKRAVRAALDEAIGRQRGAEDRQRSV